MNHTQPRQKTYCYSKDAIIAWPMVAALMILTGCTGYSNIEVPDFDPEAAAEAVLTQYDIDGDGQLSSQELSQCPGIQQNLKLYDENGDKVLDKHEITERLRYIRSFKVGLTRVMARVQLSGRPLPGAKIHFEPEAFYDGAIQPAEGVTNSKGLARMSIPAELLPEDQHGIHGMHFGTYKVIITHPQKVLPAKYNTDTILGYETVVGDPHAFFPLK